MTGIEPAYSAWEAISMPERVSDNCLVEGLGVEPRSRRYLRVMPGWRAAEGDCGNGAEDHPELLQEAAKGTITLAVELDQKTGEGKHRLQMTLPPEEQFESFAARIMRSKNC
jgi:hypothetical protein